VERRARNPLVPLVFFADRTRSVINGTTLFFMAAFISYTFLLTLFLQHVLGYSPLQGGLAWLPLSAAMGAGIGLGTALTPRLGVRVVVGAGFAGAGVGLFLTSLAGVDASYIGGIVPGMVVFGLFAGATIPAATNASLHGVTVQDSSLASGVQSTMQQIGAALGVAVLVTIALRHATDAVQAGVPADVATTDGYAVAFRVGAALLVLGAILNAALMERVATELRDPMAETAESIH
jgi:MFS family permease